MNRAKVHPRRWGYEAVAARPRMAGTRRLAWGKLASTPLLAALLLLLTNLFLADGYYVFVPQVQGNLVTSREAIIAMSGIQGYNIFFVDPQEVAARVVLLPDIARAKVWFALPNRVIIEVEERKPHLLWRVGEEVYPVDAAGVVLSPQEVEVGITIRQLEDQTLKPGERVDPNILSAAEAFHGLAPELVQFDYSPQYGLSIVNASGTQVILGMEDRAAEKLALLQAVEEHLRGKGIIARMIDLRFDPPYFMPIGEGN